MWREAADAERRNDYGAALYVCDAIARNGDAKARRKADAKARWLRFERARAIVPSGHKDVGFDTDLTEAIAVFERALSETVRETTPVGRYMAATACTSLARLYSFPNIGVEHDRAKAHSYNLIAAELGDADRPRWRMSRADRRLEDEAAWLISHARYGLGLDIWLGYEPKADEREAIVWFRRAGETGFGDPLKMLADAYAEGRGVEKDLRQAFILRRRATRDRSSWAEDGLARMYETGQGVARSYRLAYKWYRKSPFESAKQRAQAIKPLARKEENSRLAIFGAVGLLVLILPLVLFGPAKIIWWAAPVMAALVLSLAFVAAPQIGAANRVRVSQKFAAAQKSGAPVRIGGQKWVHSEGAFFHVVVSGGPRGTLYGAETNRNSRFSAELKARQLRRLLVIGLAAALATCGFVHAVITSVVADSGIADLLGGLFGFAAFLGVLFVLGWEIFYQRGNQLISGAMVLDPDPMEGQREQVASQKALGDAEFNSEGDAIAAASGARRLPIHDQEF